MALYILRHADKEPGDFYTPQLPHDDQPISAKGREQAERLPAFFADKAITAIYVSAYQRTLQTIAPVAEQLCLTPIVDERLNEFDNGRVEKLAEAEIQEQFPDVWKAFTERKVDFRFPEGETGGEVQQRIMSFLAEKQKQYESENIIAVSHDGLIQVMMCSLLNIPVYKRWNFQVDTCGITEIVYQPDYDEWKIVRFNQTCA